MNEMIKLKDSLEGCFTYNKAAEQFVINRIIPEEGLENHTFTLEWFKSQIKQSYEHNLSIFLTANSEDIEKQAKFVFEYTKNNQESRFMALNCIYADEKWVKGTITDVTQLIETIGNLTREKEQAEYNDRIKSAFLANMAHDIRTPLNSIAGFAEMMTEDGFTADEKREFSEIIERNTDILVNMINDIIDVSKIEAGQIEISDSTFNPEELMFDLFGKYQYEIERYLKKDVRLNIAVPPNTQPLFVKTDKLRLRQILEQLLSNAVKFTHRGNITMGYTINDDTVAFYVKDTGIGIPVDKQQQVFHLFKKDEDVYTKPFGSIGLGLHIAKKLTHMLGSEITLNSTPAKGTVFSFELKEAKQPELLPSQKPVSAQTTGWSGKKILIVDDLKEIYEYVRLSLRASHVTCLYAPSGRDAIKVLDTITDIDMVLLDIQMPGMNGFSTLEEIRKSNDSIPVLALTAFALNGDREKILSAGFNEYISKPIKQRELYKALKMHL
jgi:signal transduction histidine kinase